MTKSEQQKQDAEFEAAVKRLVRDGLSGREIAKAIGVSERCFFSRKARWEERNGRKLSLQTSGSANKAKLDRLFTASELPDEDATVEELIADRLKYTSRKLKAATARELVDIKLHVEGPYGIALIGDPHIDNPGCNLQLLLDHAKLIRETDGMLAVCVGDVQDAWVGRLSRLWAGQGIEAKNSLKLVNYYLEQLGDKLVALCFGNHDSWADGVNGQSPLEWIRGRYGSVAERAGMRLRLTQKDGHSITINLRHDFPGRSQYNAAHGPNRALLFGCRDDVAVAGHTHEYGHGVRLDPETRKPMHAVRLGSYKHSDDYARELGLLDNNVTECAVLMVNPAEPDPRHRTWIVTNPFRAAIELAALRAEYGKAKTRSIRKERRSGTRKSRSNRAA